MPITKLNGTELFYLQSGSGHPCLMMHGGLGLDHTHLHPWLDPLGDTLGLVYYDHRGNGRSGRPPLSTLNFEQFSNDADVLRGHLKLGKIALFGHSYGSFIALDYALRYQQHLSHLILVSAAPAVDYWDEIQTNMRRRGATEEMVASFRATDWHDDQALKRHMDLLGHLNFAEQNVQLREAVFEHTVYSAPAREAAFELLKSYDLVARLRDIAVPTLIVVGREDVFTPVSQAERLHRGIPNSELVVLDDSGHFTFVEQPKEFFAAVRSWLQRTG